MHTSAVERLESWFEQGRLLRPDADQLNTVDLTRAIARCCGADLGRLDSGGARALAEQIGEPQHLVFALVDGLGMSLVDRLAPDGFFRTHLALELRSVFPSATAAAVTALATGEWPAAHAVPGWWLFVEEHDLTCVSLPFLDRDSGAPLAERGLTPSDLYPAPSLLGTFQRPALIHQPTPISDSPYSLYARGPAPGRGYETFDDGVDAVVERIGRANGPTYDYLYTPSVDKASHDHGPDSPEALAVAQAIEGSLARLASELAGRARLIVSADHGQICVPRADKHLLLPDDPLRALLRCDPTGEPRTPLFHVRPGRVEAFQAAFQERFGASYALLSTDEVERLELLGPGLLSRRTRQRLGDYLGVARDRTVILAVETDGPGGIVSLVGHHGGLDPEEVRIPLVLA